MAARSHHPAKIRRRIAVTRLHPPSHPYGWLFFAPTSDTITLHYHISPKGAHIDPLAFPPHLLIRLHLDQLRLAAGDGGSFLNPHQVSACNPRGDRFGSGSVCDLAAMENSSAGR